MGPEVGRQHLEASAVCKAQFNDDQSLNMAVELPDGALEFHVPDGVGGWGWESEIQSGSEYASLSLNTIHFSTHVYSGGVVQLHGPLEFTVPPLKARLLTRTYRDTDRSDAPPFRYEDDDDD